MCTHADTLATQWAGLGQGAEGHDAPFPESGGRYEVGSILLQGHPDTQADLCRHQSFDRRVGQPRASSALFACLCHLSVCAPPMRVQVNSWERSWKNGSCRQSQHSGPCAREANTPLTAARKPAGRRFPIGKTQPKPARVHPTSQSRILLRPCPTCYQNRTHANLMETCAPLPRPPWPCQPGPAAGARVGRWAGARGSTLWVHQRRRAARPVRGAGAAGHPRQCVLRVSARGWVGGPSARPGRHCC